MTGLLVRDVTVRFDSRTVLDNVRLAVAPGEIVGLVGPSGCGKSTLLRAVAGLQSVASGTVSWDDHDITDTPTHRRRFGMVFQDHQLFPHLDVAGNVGFGLRMDGVDKPTRAGRVRELLAVVGLDGYERRRVSTLSGGESQRIALARALAPRPRLLLLDEPLAALDLELRTRLAEDLRRILKSETTAAIHVTHDPNEVAIVCDRVEQLAAL